MIIDAHVHCSKNMSEIVDSAKKNGIDKICVSSLGTPHWFHNPVPREIKKANDEVIRAMRDFPEEVIGFCYLNPVYTKESLEELERCIKTGMRGIKLWVACKASDRKLHPIAEEAIRFDIPILQHSFNKITGNYSNESGSEDVCVLAEQFPKLKIIMAHLTGAGYKGILKIKKHKNIFIDSSGGFPVVAVTEYAIKQLGAERIVFGSDAPGRNFAVQLGRVYGANIPEKDRRLILGENMRKILKI